MCVFSKLACMTDRDWIALGFPLVVVKEIKKGLRTATEEFHINPHAKVRLLPHIRMLKALLLYTDSLKHAGS